MIAENTAEILPLHEEFEAVNKTIRPHINLNGLMDGVIMNPIIAVASPLLAGLTQLKLNPVCEDMHVLQQNLIKEVISFEAKAKQQEIDDEAIDNARYVLCACFDEVILNYCQDKAGNELGQHSLISVFYHETSGGENVFVLLEKLMRRPSANIDLLELISLCLGIGFEGKYRVMARGFEQLGILSDQLFRCIRQQRGDISKQLSADVINNKIEAVARRRISLGIIVGVTALLLALIGVGFNVSLNQDINPVAKMLQQL